MSARLTILPGAPMGSVYAGLDQGRIALESLVDIDAAALREASHGCADPRDTVPESDRVTDEPGGDL